MVSPSKKQKTKLQAKVSQSSKKISTGGSEHSQRAKPLSKKKFYLDLRSHVTSSKLESNLKLLGASVELFLVREVNVVVTDRPQWAGGGSGSQSGSTPKCALPSPSPSFLTPGSPATLDSPGDGLGRRRSKTRAEAMLERARLQPQQSTIDPLDNATRWGIPIWPLEKILRWLDKVNERTKSKDLVPQSQGNHNSPKSRKLKTPYIKIESVHGGYRPIYKEFSLWPSINLEFESGGCPFSPIKEVKKEKKNTDSVKDRISKKDVSKSRNEKTPDYSRMTRKVRPRVRSEERGSAPLSGYCEICQLNYTDRKKHLQAESHTKFVSNERNFFTLDTLIKQGSNMEAFLKMNGGNELSRCTLFGSTRRSLRSVVRLHSLDASPPQVSPGTGSWKGLLSPSRKSPLSSFSNGHATRSASNTKQPTDEKAFSKGAGQKEMLEVQCNGGTSPHCYGTRYGSKGVAERLSPSHRRSSHWDEHPSVRARPQRARTTSASFCNTMELSQLSPTGSDSGHHLRSRGQLWLPANLLGTTAEDDGNPIRSRAGQGSQGTGLQPLPAQVLKDAKESVEDVEERLNGSVPCRDERAGEEEKTYHGNGQAIKKKRLTAEEKLIEDNRAYYKLEVKNNKLRSSGHFPSPTEIDLSTLTVEQESIQHEPAVLKEASSTEKCCTNQVKAVKADNTDCCVVEEDIVKFRKIRLSEVSLLSNEAENFMFGEPPRRDSTDESSDDDCEEENKMSKALKKEHIDGELSVKVLIENKKNTSSIKHDEHCSNKKDGSKSKDHPVNIPPVVHLKLDENSRDASNVLQCDESSMGSIDTCSLASSCDTNTPVRRRRKRRTHAEAFIHDNLDYYKFEIPGSRLRFQGSILPQTVPACGTVTGNENEFENSKEEGNGGNTKPSNNGECNKSGTVFASKDSKDMCTHSNTTSHCRDDLKSQDNIKQDMVEKPTGKNLNESSTKEKKTNEGEEEEEGREVNEKQLVLTEARCTDEAMEGLHFSFEAVPQSEPWFQTYQRQDEGEEFYLACLSDCGYYWKPFLLPYEMPTSELLNPLAGPSGIVGSSGTAAFCGLNKKRRNRFAHMLDKKPRKSPRCHASTLAILSSLMNHRKRKEPDKTKNEEEPHVNAIPEGDESSRASTSKVVLPPVVEFTSESDLDMKEIALNIDKMFAMSPEEENSPVVSDRDAKEDFASGKHVKSKFSRCKKSHKYQGNNTNTNTKKLEQNIVKETEMIDIDPAVLKELASTASNLMDCIPQPTVKCKGGPSIDVLTLLDGFSECHCMEDVSISNKECANCGNDQQSTVLRETSCNSSECGASSTCETIAYSDVPESTVRIRGRKRKRKKNLTGWPVDKQRLKKKVLKKTEKDNENFPRNKEPEEKFNNICVKVNNVLVGENIAIDVNSKNEPSSTGIKGSELDKCGKLTGVFDKAQVVQGENNLGDVELNKSVSSIGGINAEKVMSIGENFVSTGLVSNLSTLNRHPSKEECLAKVNSSSEMLRTDRHASFSRISNLDATTRSSDYQPCVRVKKIDNIADIHFLSATVVSGTSGVANNRRLRSASSSSFSSSSPIRKKQCPEDSMKSTSTLMRRASSRRRKPKFGTKWDSWSTRKRR